MNTRTTRLLIGLGVAAGVLIVKLFAIQILNDRYKRDASNNSMVYETIYPTRGIIYDRNGKIIVGNTVSYDILVTPREVQPFDTVQLAASLGVTPDVIREKMAEYRRNRSRIGYQTVVMLKKVPPETYMKFAEMQYKFPGFRGQMRSIRDYPFNAGGNLLGYVSEVDADFIKKHPGEYRSGDYAGKTGIEAARENVLLRIPAHEEELSVLMADQDIADDVIPTFRDFPDAASLPRLAGFPSLFVTEIPDFHYVIQFLSVRRTGR